jgi:hypothetical protein
MTPKPGVSLLDQLRALENSVDMLRHTLDKIVDEDELRVGLSKTAAAWAGQLGEGIAGARRLVAAGAPGGTRSTSPQARTQRARRGP